MKKYPGFTLIELVVAILISGFIAVALATIYSTANRHIFQNYRGNTIKSDVSLGMRAIRNVMAQATRIDQPLSNTSGTRLLVASNVDQLTGCYPIGPGPATWHLFCTVTSGSNIQLYYHTGVYPNTCACPGPVPPPCVQGNPAVSTICGSFGGTLLTQFLNTTSVFSRSSTLGDIPANDSLSVRVRLHSVWLAANRGYGSVQRDVDYALDTTFSVSRPGGPF